MYSAIVAAFLSVTQPTIVDQPEAPTLHADQLHYEIKEYLEVQGGITSRRLVLELVK